MRHFAVFVLVTLSSGFLVSVRGSEFTHFESGGFGACGTLIDAKSELLAAVSYTKWTATDPADDPLCSKCVRVTYKGKTIKVPIKEKCTVCEADHVDLSLSAFKQLDNPDVGRGTGATVKIVECGGRSTTPVAGQTSSTSTPVDDVILEGKHKKYPPASYPAVPSVRA